MEGSSSQGILLIVDHTETDAVTQYLRTKPIDFARLQHALELLMRYWFSAVTRPQRRSR
jgi:hypothetical protein